MVVLGFMAFLSFGLPKETIKGDTLAASGFPLISIGIGFLLCVILLLKQARAGKKQGGKLLDLSTPAGKAILFSGLLLVAYLMLMNLLGFIVSTFLFSITAPMVMGYRNKGKLAVFALLTTIGLVLLFGKAFYVQLPRGIGFLRELSYFLY